jgi:dimethylaniline monooxygenase (N-oxide forming)
MGFNIYEDTQKDVEPRRSFKAGDVLEAAETIFFQHAQGDVVLPGTCFDHMCKSLAHAYPQTVLVGLQKPQMEGRAWTLFDTNNDGVLSVDEFIEGIQQLLNPTKPEMVVFVDRLKQGIMGKFPRTTTEYSDIKTVGIIGAGVAGLQVANLLKKIGKTVTVFDKAVDVGGVWRENYADFGLQVPKELYEFPGFPYPKDKNFSLFPKGGEVYEYIKMYATAMNLYPDIKFETAVLGAAPSKTGWTIKFQKKGGRPESQEFDFLVCCTGMYGWPPHIPKANGWKKFQGEIVHSCTFTDKEQAKGKKVVVVGGGKSAVDNCVAAAKTGISATLVAREPHWPVPRYLANAVPFKYGTYSRFGHFMLPTHHEEPSCFWWFHSTCAPVKWVWWRVVETMFKVQFKLSKEHTPKAPIDNDLFTGGQILTYEFRDMLEEKKLDFKIGAIDYMKEKSVVLTDGTEIECDMVIYGTGFKKSYDLFDNTFVQSNLMIEKDGLYLYRNIIPPAVPRLAFVGSEVSTFNNILTHGLQAKWLQKLLSGEMALPGGGGMQKIIEKEQAWKRSWMPPSSARASIWQLHMTKYHDMLVGDMGESHRRKCDPVSEVFMPYTARDYAKLFE